MMWSMISFMTAFSVLFFNRSTATARATVGVVLIATGALVLWCLITFWERGDDHEERKAPGSAETWAGRCAAKIGGCTQFVAGLRHAQEPTPASTDGDSMNENGKIRHWTSDDSV